MAIWKITNATKKNAVERQFWIKDGVTIIKEEGFRWGIWSCESDEQPDVDLDNSDGYELMSTDYEWEMEEMIDGSWVDWTFPEDMDEEEQERIQELWDEIVSMDSKTMAGSMMKQNIGFMVLLN